MPSIATFISKMKTRSTSNRLKGEEGVALESSKNRKSAKPEILEVASEEESDLIEDDMGFEYDSDESAFDQSDYDEDDDDELINDEYNAKSLNPREPLKFKRYTTVDLVKKMSSLADHYSDVLKLSKDDTITLLQFYSWNNEKLMDDYMDDPDKVKAKAGLSTLSLLESKVEFYYKADFPCPICCEDKSQSYQLKCRHEFCIECYDKYIKENINSGKVITCPSCELALTRNDIDTISGKGESFKLLENSIKEYVERQKNYKWCPGPDCNVVIEILNADELPTLVSHNKIPVATCQHGHQFCVSCSFENHTPAPCNTTKAWIRKCKDDSETVKWIMTNTKQCPKCDSFIEKNGGCNHMTCKKCRYEFCWICQENWKCHGSSYYQCTRYNKFAEKSKLSAKEYEESKRSLQRYSHYYGLFSVYEQSTKQDSKRCAEVESKVRELQESSGISWIEAQFIAESATSLLQARNVLKWSCAFGYYCEATPYFTIYENTQADLVKAVEALSKLFETEEPAQIVESKLAFLNAQSYLIDRQKAMISCAAEAVDNGTLSVV